jgi:hypothetical protein
MRNIFVAAVAVALGAASVANAGIGLCGNVAYADGKQDNAPQPLSSELT